MVRPHSLPAHRRPHPSANKSCAADSPGTGLGKLRIPPEESAYSFRHSRISELLEAYGIDPLTVAQQAGTSLAMIEKAYFRFIPSATKEKLEAAR